MVRLEFQAQQWLPVLQWLAKMRNLNLDWQQLPEGTLNLASANEYSLDDAEDLINMQLLARGFTLLQRGEVLRLAPLKNIDITLVPRVDAQELEKLPRHRFVRVTFPLDWMIAEEAKDPRKYDAEERAALKSLLRELEYSQSHFVSGSSFFSK